MARGGCFGRYRLACVRLTTRAAITVHYLTSRRGAQTPGRPRRFAVQVLLAALGRWPRGLSSRTEIWAVCLPNVPLVSLVPSRRARSSARGSEPRRCDELGVVCIATPDLACDDGHSCCIGGFSGG